MINLMQFMTFNLLIIYLEHKIKRILALLNWKVNFKSFNPEIGQNQCSL